METQKEKGKVSFWTYLWSYSLALALIRPAQIAIAFILFLTFSALNFNMEPELKGGLADAANILGLCVVLALAGWNIKRKRKLILKKESEIG